MNVTTIEIDGEDLVLDNNARIYLTVKSLEIGSLSTRFTSVTNKFRAPFTSNNDRLLKYARFHMSTTRSPYVIIPCRLKMNGVAVLLSASLVISSCTDSFYELIVAGNTKEFFNEIGDKKLSDLNTDDINPIWWSGVSPTIQNYRNTTTGIIAPVMDYGKYNTGTNNVDLPTYLPSVYYHTIINKIIEQAGFKKQGNIFNDDQYLKTIVAYSKDSWSYGNIGDEFSAAKTVSQNFVNPPIGTVVTVPINVNGNLNYKDHDALGYPYWKNLNTFWITADGFAEVNLTVNSGNIRLSLWSPLNGNVAITGFFTAGTYVVQLDTRTQGYATGVLFQNGDVLLLRIDSGGGAGNADVTGARFYSRTRSTISETAFTTLAMNKLLPDMTQKEFMQDFLVSFGQLVTEENGTLKFKSITEAIDSKALAPDWSKKRSGDFKEIKFDPLKYGRLNTFEYEATEELYDKTFYDGQIVVNNENARERVSVLRRKSKATATVFRGQILMASIPIYSLSTTRTDFDNGSPGIRFLLVRDKYSNEPNVTYDIARADYKVAYFDDPAQTNSMRFNHILNKYYGGLFGPLNNAKTLKAFYNLNELDIKSVDITIPIFDTDSYYLIQEIKNFIPGQLTEVTLFKL